MKKSKRRNSSLKTRRRRRRSQKMWNMRGCASKRNRVCVKCHHKCSRNGMCPTCHHKCAYNCGRSSRNKRGGSPDAPFAYTGMGNGPSVPNPHYAYTGLQKGGGYVDIQSPLAPQNLDPAPQPPFVGAPWGPTLSQLPGVSSAHSGNYLAHNSYNIQPEMNPIDERTTSGFMGGGRRRRQQRKGSKITKRRMRGGTFGFLSELGNNLSNAYRGLNGEAALPSPLPYQDQMFYGRNAQDNLNYLKVG
jgi:hypothetical protein